MNSKILEIEIGDLILSVLDVNRPRNVKILKPHFHSMYEFQYVQEDRVCLRTKDHICTAEKGEYLLVPPDCFHWTEYGAEDLNRYALLFSLSPSGKGTLHFSEYRYYKRIFDDLKTIDKQKNSQVSDCIRKLLSLEQEPAECNEHKRKVYYSMLFLALAEDRILMEGLDETIKEGRMELPLEKQKLRGELGEYISQNYTKRYLIEELAQMLHMSQRNVSRTIQELFGTSLSTLVLNQRMISAWGFVTETDLPLGEIAELVGYQSYNAFYRAFRGCYGFSPEYLRKK